MPGAAARKQLTRLWAALLVVGLGCVGPARAEEKPPPFRAPEGDPLAGEALKALRARYLEARAHHRAGRTSQAERIYRALVREYPPMAGPIRSALTEIALSRLDGEGALTWADELIRGEGEDPAAVLAAEAPQRPGGSLAAWGYTYRGEALVLLGRLPEAAAAFEVALSLRARGGPPRDRLHAQLGQVYERQGAVEKAWRQYLLAAKGDASSSHTRVGVDGAYRLEGRVPPESRVLRELLRAEIVEDLIAQGRDQEALRRAQEVMATCESPEVMRQLEVMRTRCEARLTDPDEGVRLLHRLTYQPNLSGALYWDIVHDLQRLMAQQKDVDGRVNILRRYLATFPGAEESIEARLLLASVLSDDGRDAEAETLYREIIRLYPDAPGADDARWELAWSRIRSGDLAGAFPILRDHVETVVPGSRAEARAVYWLARAAEAQGRPILAWWMWTDVVRRFPNSWYGSLAWWRTGGAPPEAVVAVPQGSIPATLPITRESVLGDGGSIDPEIAGWELGRSLLFPGFIDLLGGVRDPSVAQALARSMELGLMGQGSEALVNLADVRADPRADGRAYLIVAAALHAYGQAQAGMRVAHLHLSHDGFPTLHGPRERRWALAYPWPYLDLFSREAYRQGIQPALLVAMAQQESGFGPTAVSPVGARGILQLMPRTAASVAASQGLKAPTAKELNQPPLNMRLGAAYLRDMLDTFQGDVVRAVAAYNAGPGAIQRWNRKLGDVDADVWVEEIPYDETRDYVRIVLRNYAGYRALYPGMLYTARSFPPAPPSGILLKRTPRPAPVDVEAGPRRTAADATPTPAPDEPGGLVGPGGALDW